MKFSQIQVGKTYVCKGESREVIAICAKTNNITYREGGRKETIRGQNFAAWAKTEYRDPNTRKPKEEKRASV